MENSIVTTSKVVTGEIKTAEEVKKEEGAKTILKNLAEVGKQFNGFYTLFK